MKGNIMWKNYNKKRNELLASTCITEYENITYTLYLSSE